MTSVSNALAPLSLQGRPPCARLESVAVAAPARRTRLHGERMAVAAIVLGAHLAGLAALAQLAERPLRPAEPAPIQVALIAAPSLPAGEPQAGAQPAPPQPPPPEPAPPEPAPPEPAPPPPPPPPPEPAPAPPEPAPPPPKPKPKPKPAPQRPPKPAPRPAPPPPTPAPAESAPLQAPVQAPASTAPAAVPAPAAVGTPSAGSAAAAPIRATEARFDAAYLNNPTPIYPMASRRLREEGRVMLRVRVSAAGLPAQIELRTSSGSGRLDRAAQDAVARWRFVPARRGGQAIEAWVLVPIEFKLQGN